MIKAKNKTLLFLLLLLPIFCFAQKQHELKTDLISGLNRTISLSYEYGLSQRIGLEADVQYEFQKRLSFERLGSPPQDSLYFFQYLHFTIGSNYYFFPKKGIDRFFLGFAISNSFRTKVDKDYISYQEEYYPNSFSDISKTWRSSSIGIKSGYKWLIKDSIIIEPELLLYYELRPIIGDRHFDWDLIVNVGYRF